MLDSRIEVPDEISPLPLGVSEINTEIPITRMREASSKFDAIVIELNSVDKKVTDYNNNPAMSDSSENKGLKIWKLRLKQVIMAELKKFLNTPDEWLLENADNMVN